MYKIKTLAQRGSAFLAVVGLLSGMVSSALPALASADALNPLTERSLTLTSSSPGFHYLDGSGNSTYAPAGSGNNGQKTGETFTFKVSTDSTSTRAVKGFTFQYCTSPAGLCGGPGNTWIPDDDGAGPHVAHRVSDDASHTDLSVHYANSPVDGTDYKVEYVTVPDDDGNGPHVDTWATDTANDWDIATSNLESASLPTSQKTGKDNLITLTTADSGLQLASGTKVRITFKGTDNNYITNPGSGAFFVKINDYDTGIDDTNGDSTGGDLNPTTVDNSHIVDGGVTVANVMNDSIQIQTKVLETMSFSVGTVNPDAVIADGNNDGDNDPGEEHGTCDAISVNDPLDLGDSTAEFSLKDSKAYDVHSYWRLSSNSSGGATVYYSGNTLSNTVGDQIDAIGTTAKVSHPGTEQFGLALDSTADTLDTQMQTQIDDDAALSTPLQYPHKAPHLTPLYAAGDALYTTGTNYKDGSGGINSSDSGGISALFAFDPASLSIAVPIASESDDVVDCATGKMRYVANIAATTPAGVYTSRINYVASPEY